MLHIFFQCGINKKWRKIREEWNNELDIVDMMIEAKKKNKFNNLFKKAVLNHRNKIIFDREHRDLDQCYSFLRSSIMMFRHRDKTSLKDGM
jgi:predicted SAM-dependent methyltransferase